MAQKSDRLTEQLEADQRSADQAQRSFLKAEDRLDELAEREARRAQRERDLEQR